eukprot:2588208-Rhodomonas_salina.1
MLPVSPLCPCLPWSPIGPYPPHTPPSYQVPDHVAPYTGCIGPYSRLYLRPLVALPPHLPARPDRSLLPRGPDLSWVPCSLAASDVSPRPSVQCLASVSRDWFLGSGVSGPRTGLSRDPVFRV